MSTTSSAFSRVRALSRTPQISRRRRSQLSWACWTVRVRCGWRETRSVLEVNIRLGILLRWCAAWVARSVESGRVGRSHLRSIWADTGEGSGQAILVPGRVFRVRKLVGSTPSEPIRQWWPNGPNLFP